ncbi:MAG TPA: PRC-barrel domain-containing protein, partial [Terriglobales bacterium]|nr:PRC-barrel domain-containing protein [Terriglobales bacterium]
GPDHDKLGKIDDVIFDHATGAIQYAVVDTGGWLSSKKFLVPADRIHPDAKNQDDFAINATKQQIERLPKYDEDAVRTEAAWNDYDSHYREAWEHGPLLQKEGSTHTITPEPSELPAGSGSGVADRAYEPDRLAGKFPPASEDPAKLRMRPSGLAARAEDSRLPGTFAPEEKPTLAQEEAEQRAAGNPVQAQRDHLTNPDNLYVSEGVRHARWAAFEDHLRRNRVDVTASCRSCGTARDKDRVA